MTVVPNPSTTARESNGQTGLRERLALVSRTVEREIYILTREPALLASHLHNMLFLEEGEDGRADVLLARARQALASRAWLRLTNRPPVGTSQRALLRRIRHGAAVTALAWAPGSNLLASAGRDGAVRLWDPATGKQAAELLGYEKGTSILALAWSPEGRHLASSSADGTVRQWDAMTGALGEVNRISGQPHFLNWSPDGTALDMVAWSPDGRMVATGKPVRLAEAKDGALNRILNQNAVVAAWSPDARLLATAGGFRDPVRVWDPATGALQCALTGRVDDVLALAWSPDGAILASGGWNHSVQLWDSTTGTLGTVLEGHAGAIQALAWSPDGTILASGSGDSTVGLWDPTARAVEVTPEGHAGSVSAASWSPDGTILASADLGLFGIDMVYKSIAAPGQSAELFAAGLSTSAPASVRLWDAASGTLRAVLPHSSAVQSLTWSADGKVLASTSDDGTVRHWDATTGAPTAVVASGLAASRENLEGLGTLESASEDKAVRLWDATDTAVKGMRRLHSADGPTLAWSADGRTLASAGSVRRLHTGYDDLDTDSESYISSAYCLSPVVSLMFSENGRILQAADNGASTGRRPIPYRFELCNLERGRSAHVSQDQNSQTRARRWVFWRR